MSRVLIIGLDGATWDILELISKEYKLPNFTNLINKGIYGNLQSTIPPVTGPSWISFATGKNPGKTGIFDFLNPKIDKYNLKSVNSYDFYGNSIWDYISNKGKKVGIVNFPMLFPPYELNGFMISGFGSSVDENFTFPKNLKKKIENIVDNYEITVSYHNKRYNDEYLYLQDVYRVLDKRVKLIKYLMLEDEWDLFISIFSCTDWIQHLMWKHLDKSHPLYDPNRSEKYKQEFIKFWIKIDKIIGEIIDIAGKDTILFIISDHGFGSNDETFNLAKWLKIKGYLILKKNIKNNIKSLFNKVLLSINHIPLKKAISYKTRRKFSYRFQTNITDIIDFEKSKAYCLGHSIPFGAIYINSKNIEKDKLISQLIEDLHNLKRDINKEVNVQIFEPKKIYQGSKINMFPELIFTIDNWKCVITEDNFSRPLFEEKPFSSRHTGSHRRNGILLAMGPGIKRNYKIENSRIYDIFPTILHIFDLPITKDIDGRVLTEIFEQKSVYTKRKIKFVNQKYYMKEEDKLKKTIKNLNLNKRI